MNFKTTLILLLLLIGIGGYFLFAQPWASPRTGWEPDEPGHGQPLFAEPALDAADITRVSITRPRAAPQRVERIGEHWVQSQPARFMLQTEMGEQLAGAIAALHYDHRFIPGEDDAPEASELGLEDPRAVMEVRAGEQTYTLELGRRLMDGRAHLRIAGSQEAYIVNDTVHQAALDTRMRDWRRRELPVPGPHQARRIVKQSEGRAIELHEHGGRWFLDEDRTERAGREQVGELLERLSELRIERFAADLSDPDELQDYGLTEPRGELRIDAPAITEARLLQRSDAEPTALRPYHLRIGSPTDMDEQSYYASYSIGTSVSPVVFTLARQDIERLFADRDALRERQLITTAPAEIAALELTHAGDDEPTLHWHRDARGVYRWDEQVDPGFRLDYQAAMEQIEALPGIEATGFEPAQRIENEHEPVATLTLHPRSSRDTAEQIRFFKPSDDEAGYFGVRGDEPVAYRFDAERLTPLLRPRSAWREQTLLAIPADELVELRIVRDDGASYHFQRQDDDWTMRVRNAHPDAALPDDAQLEQFERDALTRLLNMFDPLWAQQWVDSPADDHDWTMTLELVLADGTTHQMPINPQTGRARLDDLPTPFELPEHLAEQLQREYRPQRVLSMSVSDIEQVQLSTADTSATIVRRGDDRYRWDADESISQSAAARLFDALAGLEALRYHDTPPAEQQLTAMRTLRLSLADEQTYELTLLHDGDGRTLARLDLDHQQDATHLGPWIAHVLEHSNAERMPAIYFELPQRTWQYLAAPLSAGK